jgi:AcrR family transcriptional regulator
MKLADRMIGRAMGRRTKEERRRDYLDIGAALVAEAATTSPPDAGLALAHVKVADVAERAGVTKGALYHLWPSQEDYWHDLLEFLFEQDQLLGEETLAVEAERIRAALAGTEPGDAAEYANAVFDLVKDDPAFLTRVAVYSYLYDAELLARLDAEFRAGLARFADVVEWGVGRLGRRLRPGVSREQLAVAVVSLLHGTVLEYRLHPDRTPDLSIDGRRVSLFALGAGALIRGFTVADRDADAA